MKTSTTARYPLRVILSVTLIIAQLGSFSAHAVGGDPLPATPGAAATLLGADPNTGAPPPRPPASPAAEASAQTQDRSSAPGVSRGSSAPSQTGNTIVRTMKIRGEEYTYEARATQAVASSDDLVVNADGTVTRAAAGAPRQVLKFQIRGCDGTCPEIADLNFVNGVALTLSQIDAHLQKETARIYNERKEAESLDKKLSTCQAVKDSKGNTVKVTNKNRKELRDEILNCQVAAATEDKNPDREDEEMTLGEVSGSKIGGMLRRAMISLDKDDRDWALEMIEKLQDEHGDESAAVDGYLDRLAEGARQINRILELGDMSEDNPQARNQIFAEFERAAAAWNPALHQNKGEGSRRAISDVYSMMKAYGCQAVRSSMSQAPQVQGAGQVANQCNSIDSAVQDGRDESRGEDSTVPGSTTGSVIPNADVTRGQRIGNQPSLIRAGPSLQSQGLIVNPNQNQYSTTVNTNVIQPVTNGTVRGTRFN